LARLGEFPITDDVVLRFGAKRCGLNTKLLVRQTVITSSYSRNLKRIVSIVIINLILNPDPEVSRMAARTSADFSDSSPLTKSVVKVFRQRLSR